MSYYCNIFVIFKILIKILLFFVSIFCLIFKINFTLKNKRRNYNEQKILVSLSIILFTIFSFTICQATDDVMKGATNNIRNFVGGVENTVHPCSSSLQYILNNQ